MNFDNAFVSAVGDRGMFVTDILLVLVWHIKQSLLTFMVSFFVYLLLVIVNQLCENSCLQSDLLCVEWDVKPYSHSLLPHVGAESYKIGRIHFLTRCRKRCLKQALVSLDLVLFGHV